MQLKNVHTIRQITASLPANFETFAGEAGVPYEYQGDNVYIYRSWLLDADGNHPLTQALREAFASDQSTDDLVLS